MKETASRKPGPMAFRGFRQRIGRQQGGGDAPLVFDAKTVRKRFARCMASRALGLKARCPWHAAVGGFHVPQGDGKSITQTTRSRPWTCTRPDPACQTSTRTSTEPHRKWGRSVHPATQREINWAVAGFSPWPTHTGRHHEQRFQRSRRERSGQVGQMAECR